MFHGNNMTLLMVTVFETEVITKEVNSTLGASASAAKNILSSQGKNRRSEMQKRFRIYKKHGLEIEAMLTDNGREYCGRLNHHHDEIYLELNGIEHCKTREAMPETNGFAERFNRKSKRNSLTWH